MLKTLNRTRALLLAISDPLTSAALLTATSPIQFADTSMLPNAVRVAALPGERPWSFWYILDKGALPVTEFGASLRQQLSHTVCLLYWFHVESNGSAQLRKIWPKNNSRISIMNSAPGKHLLLDQPFSVKMIS